MKKEVNENLSDWIAIQSDHQESLDMLNSYIDKKIQIAFEKLQFDSRLILGEAILEARSKILNEVKE